jgi:lantibiotic biosynthesis protein
VSYYGPRIPGVSDGERPAVGQLSAQLSGVDGERSAEFIKLTAHRLANPAHIARALSRGASREPDCQQPSAIALSHCLSDTAMLYTELARFDQCWLAVADRHMRIAASLLAGPESYAPTALLFAAQGLAGYSKSLRRTLVDWIASRQHERIAFFRSRPAPGVSWQEYDMIKGLSRTLRVLLDAIDDPIDTAASAESAVDATLRHFVRISEPIAVDGHAVPGWWVPASMQPAEYERRAFPRGNFNLGLAHGAAAPLTLLSLALQRHREVEGQRDAIRRYADWLVGWTLRDERGSYFPCWVDWAQQVVGERPVSPVTRTAWCYGAPGVAHALYQAGMALNVTGWKQAALSSLHAALSREEPLWRLDGPTVCHGYAGLLQVLWRVGTASGDARLLEGSGRVARSVLNFANPDRSFVFSHLVANHPHVSRAVASYHATDLAGIRNGAAGVACALLSVTSGHLLAPGDSSPAQVANPSWDRCLALS